MKKIAFLTCNDLSQFITDENKLIPIFKKNNYHIDEIPWNSKIISWSEYETVIVRTTWDYTYHLEEFLKTLNEISLKTKLLNSLNIINWNSKKNYLLELANKKINIVPIEIVDNLSSFEYQHLFEKWNTDKLILKPLIGANSDFTFILTKSLWQNEIKNIQIQNEKQMMISPFFNEIYDGEISLVYFNKTFSHAVKKIPKTGDFRVQEEHGGSISSYTPSRDEIEFGKNALAQIKDKLLYSRIDFIKVKNQFLLMEMELIEPSLYFRTNESSPIQFYKAYQELK